MHKRATWIVVGFVAVVVIAAALDAVFFRSHAPASATSNDESSGGVTLNSTLSHAHAAATSNDESSGGVTLNSTLGGGATVLPPGPPPLRLDKQLRYQTPSGFTPEVHLSVPAGWDGYANAQAFSVGKGLHAHFYDDGQIYVRRIDHPFATIARDIQRLDGLTITARKPASVGGHTGVTYAITVPHSPLPAFGGSLPDGNTRATLLDFDDATLIINIQLSQDQAGRAEQRSVIQSFSFPP